MLCRGNLSRRLLAIRNLLVVFTIAWIAAASDVSAQAVTRGPYLQLGTPSGTIVRWRTDVSNVGRVRYGIDANNLSLVADDPSSTTEHIVTLTGLAPDTRYFYTVGTTSTVLSSGANQKFVTSPPAGNSKPMRIWVIGDPGTGSTDQASVRNAYTSFNTRETDLWLMLGDNAYEAGTDAEYQAKFFDVYPEMLKGSVIWPTLGNHDAGTGAIGAHPYMSMFSLPTGAQAGGVASGTKSYYAFNYGNIHFICLDSQESDRTQGGPMAQWLVSDLQQNTLPWVIAFWHHPPYSKGSHDSDTESNLVQMRSNILPILELYGVDLVLSGHSHSYERSYLLDGHYGTSNTLQPSMKKNAGDGRVSGNGAYGKPSIGPAAHEGAVYVVAGSSGQTSGFCCGAFHPAMFISLDRLGSLVLDLDGETLDVRFLRETGGVDDNFRVIKGTTSGNRPPAAAITSPANNATFNSPSTIDLTATASDSGGTIAQVAFYAGPTPIGTTTTGSPYTVTWTNPPAGNHRITARATDNGDATHISAPIFITVTQPVLPPDDPTGLAAGTVTMTSVPLTWTDHATNETSYEVERAIGGGAFSLLATKPANATSHTDNTVIATTSYSYRVRAFNNGVPSNYSNTLSVSTPGPPPTAPSNLHANNVTATQVPLTWQDKSTNESKFQVERAVGSGAFTLLVELPANTINHTDATVSPITKYSYRVRAANAGGFSAYTSAVSVTTPDMPPQAPTDLTATPVAGRQISLTWTDKSSNETGFEIERSTDGIRFSRVKTVGANVTTFGNTGLTAGKQYWYRVDAKNSFGDSPYSNTFGPVTALP